MRERRRDSGFTMVELMIVVAIIGLIASIAAPIFARTLKKAHRAAVGSEMLNIHKAMAAYYSDNGTFPTLDTETFEPLVSDGYLADAQSLLSKCQGGEVWTYLDLGEAGWWLIVYPKGDNESRIYTGQIDLTSWGHIDVNYDGVYWYHPTETPWGISRLDGRSIWH